MNVLSKAGFVILTIVCLTFILASCATIPHSSLNPLPEEVSNNTPESLKPGMDYQPEVGDVVAYDLSQKEFQEFLQQPSVDVLTEICNQFIVYSKSAKQTGYVQAEYFRIYQENIEQVNIEEEIGGFFRIGIWPISSEFIDFLNNMENFEQILSEHDINEKLSSCIIIAHHHYVAKDNQPIPPGTGPTMCIWLHTDNGDYFLENNPYLYTDPHDERFLYDFYNLKEYSQKYRESQQETAD